MADMKYWAVKILHDWLTKKPYYPFVNAEGSVYFGSDGTRMSIKAALDAIKTRLKNIEVGETEVDDKTIEYNALRQLQVKKGSLTGEYMGDASIGKEKLTDFKVQMVDGTPVLFYGDDQYKLEKFRSVVSTVFSDLKVISLTYTDAAASGGTSTATLRYSVKKTVTYSDGSTTESTLYEGGTAKYALTSGDSDVTINQDSGVITFANANTSTTTKRTATAKVTVTYRNGTDTLTVTKDATASQKVATVQDYVYMGFLPTSISGFTGFGEALLSSITANMIDQAITSGDITKRTTLPIVDEVVTGTENYFFIMACPVDQTNQYNLKCFDALTGYKTMEQMFDDPLRSTDGGVTKMLSDGKTYKLFTFCCDPFDYKLKVDKQ